MSRRRTSLVSVLTALAALALVDIGAAHGTSTPPEQSAPIHQLASARRLAFPQPALTGPIDDIVVVADSLYFDHATIDFGPTNSLVPRVQSILRAELGDPTIRVRNLSRPGLATAFPTGARELGFINVADYLPQIFPDGAHLPDLVVLAATSIDLNLNAQTPIGELVPRLVTAFGDIVDELEARGMQVVIVPTFGVNDEMYDAVKSLDLGVEVNCDAHRRSQALNAAIDRSDLPMLFPRFIGLDGDHDGSPDEHLFVDFNPGLVLDDGLHPNEIGHELMAEQISERLVDVIGATR